MAFSIMENHPYSKIVFPAMEKKPCKAESGERRLYMQFLSVLQWSIVLLCLITTVWNLNQTAECSCNCSKSTTTDTTTTTTSTTTNFLRDKFLKTLAKANALSSYSCGKVRIDSSDTPYDRRFKAEGVLTQDCGVGQEPGQNFLLPNDVVNQGFVIDLGCTKTLSSIKMKNTHNGENNDRGTKDFSLQVSLDKVTWTTIVNSTLLDAFNQGCKVKLQTFTPTTLVPARYLKFTILSVYLTGGGLEYITWTHSDVSDMDYDKYF